jgi:hypothetical protein
MDIASKLRGGKPAAARTGAKVLAQVRVILHNSAAECEI